MYNSLLLTCLSAVHSVTFVFGKSQDCFVCRAVVLTAEAQTKTWQTMDAVPFCQGLVPLLRDRSNTQRYTQLKSVGGQCSLIIPYKPVV